MQKIALVTGGSRGIGFAVATQLAKDGFNIGIIDVHTEDQYQDNFKQLSDLGSEWFYHRGSIANSKDRKAFVEAAVERFGAIHLLVNNAGVGPKERNDLLDMTEDSWDFVMGINAKGTMFMTQIVANQMLRQPYAGQKRGTIINISSCSAEVSSINRGEYCVSKAGVSMLTKLYADRLAPEGILVHEIRPGVIETAMTSVVEDKYNKLFEEGVFPIARWGQPEDIAQAVSAFASDKFLYTTGNYIDVDGGFHIKRL